MADSKNKNSDQELVQEFSQLISGIAKEVTGVVMGNTAIKEVQNLNQSIAQLERKAPEVSKDLQTAMIVLDTPATSSSGMMNKASAQAQQVLGGVSQQISDQNATLSSHLERAAKKYDELSMGSFEAYRKAMNEQNKYIIKTVVDRLVQDGNVNTSGIKAAIKETGHTVEQAMEKEVRAQSKKLQEKEDEYFASQKQQMESIENSLKKKIADLEARLGEMDQARQDEANRLASRTGWILAFNILLVVGLSGAFYWRYFL